MAVILSLKVKEQALRRSSLVVGWLREKLWRRQTIYAGLLIGLLCFLIGQLSIMPPGSADIEVGYVKTNSSFQSIGVDPLSLPHKLATFASRQINDSVRFVRAISIIFFGICTVALYRILKRWHSDKIGLFAAAMFATNATVLAIARLASPEVMLFGWSIVISLLLWLRHGNSHSIAPFTLALAATALIYVPGAPYFFLLLIIIFSNKILQTFRAMRRLSFYISLSLGLIAITPLLLSFINDPSLLRAWLLIPDNIAWASIPKNIWQVPSAFIYKAPTDPLINVSSLPIFDVASGGFFLVGLYAYQRHIRLERTRIMLLTASLSVVLGALGQTLSAILILLPFVYSVIGAGISYLLDQWYAVFPKNPFARSAGLLLITIVLLMSVYYQMTRFLVVWTNAPETRETYSRSRIIR